MKRATWTLDLTAFHGVEPKLALSYDSSRRNRLVGAGFHLDGPSRIVAHHPKGGLPVYDGRDEYALDDELLLPCSGARCVGPHHVTEHHSFQRIVRDPTNDR